jgi:PAS domain S-box-containing protein
MIVALDLRNTVTLINRKGSELLGYTEDEIIGKNWFDSFLPVRSRNEAKAVLESLVAGDIRPVEYYEHPVLTRNGDERIMVWHNAVLTDENDNVTNTILSGEDITERRLAEEEILRTTHLAVLGELSAGVAHEVNNPITGIINYAQILANKNTPGSEEHDIASRIIKESNRIAGIVSALLSFTRDSKDVKHPVSIHDVITDTLALTEAQIRKSGVNLKIDIHPDLPAVFVQPQQIEQVFLNIIGNAHYALNQKYKTAHKDKILEIKGESALNGDTPFIRVTFYDNGVGIPTKVLHKIMQPFFTTKPVRDGTGLGLSISHGIISSHGGNLTVQSDENEFTKVIIELPAYV